ncbi:hypothetical protein [Halopelagius fulvigenes]|uniref:Uncharacterized protein n=1 Tax=Halopelagius fulvigenes TaxID=1198324 RepID=A0ABD5U2A9_9EURY
MSIVVVVPYAAFIVWATPEVGDVLGTGGMAVALLVFLLLTMPALAVCLLVVSLVAMEYVPWDVVDAGGPR